jgi:hypothetical protein
VFFSAKLGQSSAKFERLGFGSQPVESGAAENRLKGYWPVLEELPKQIPPLSQAATNASRASALGCWWLSG